VRFLRKMPVNLPWAQSKGPWTGS